MHDKPNRTDLLDAARQTLQREILPHLDGEKKYAGLMIASALATVIRELQGDASHEPVRRVLDQFADLYGQDNVHGAGLDGPERIDALNRHLVREIREGLYDDEPLGPIYPILMEQAIQRLRFSNPDFIEASEYSQPSSD